MLARTFLIWFGFATMIVPDLIERAVSSSRRNDVELLIPYVMGWVGLLGFFMLLKFVLSAKAGSVGSFVAALLMSLVGIGAVVVAATLVGFDKDLSSLWLYGAPVLVTLHFLILGMVKLGKEG